MRRLIHGPRKNLDLFPLDPQPLIKTLIFVQLGPCPREEIKKNDQTVYKVYVAFGQFSLTDTNQTWPYGHAKLRSGGKTLIGKRWHHFIRESKINLNCTINLIFEVQIIGFVSVPVDLFVW